MEKNKEKTSHDESVLTAGSNELILFNDEVNTFEFVIESLVEICGHEFEQAEQCALVAHYNGKCGIKVGTFTELTPLNRSMNDRGLSTIII